MSTLSLFLEKNRTNHLKIYCVGDTMIDEYYQVKVNRISPEVPMPVMLSESHEPIIHAGGAGNVATQFKYFNVRAKLFALTNSKLQHILHEDGIETIRSLNADRQIPIKRRYLDGDTQVTRLDIEKKNYGLNDNDIKAARLNVFQSLFHQKDNADVIVLSDYNKGLFDNFTLFEGVTTIVDPKAGNLERWVGCTIFKPNDKEAQELSGLTCWKEQARYFKDKLKCEAVVITHGGKGVNGIWGDDLFEYTPNSHIHVRSAVGAGDCFVAFLAMAVGHGFRGLEAVEIAFAGGAKYVQGIKNRPITPAELSDIKVIKSEDLKRRDFSLVLTNGCFDILHEQHIDLLKFAKTQADKLVVAVNSDDSIKRLKGENRPVVPLKHRLATLAALECVDFIIIFDGETPLNLIQAVKPDCLVKGGDYKAEDVVGYKEVGGNVVIFPYTEGVSTTDIIENYVKKLGPSFDDPN